VRSAAYAPTTGPPGLEVRLPTGLTVTLDAEGATDTVTLTTPAGLTVRVKAVTPGEAPYDPEMPPADCLRATLPNGLDVYATAEHVGAGQIRHWDWAWAVLPSGNEVDVEAMPPSGEARVTVRREGGAKALPLYQEAPAKGGTAWRVVPGRWRAYVMDRGPASDDQDGSR
jgi:hypothetical protein